MKILLLLLLIFSCNRIQRKSNFSGTTFYTYKDPSGTYLLKRDLIETKNKIQLRQKLLGQTSDKKPLEKSITISQVGVIKTKKGKTLSIRPFISQFSIWFEKKKYFSQFKLNKKEKKLDLILRSPEAKWNRTESLSVESGKIFCWFSQIPECLRRANLLVRERRKKINFIVIWESFPYYTEQYQNVPSEVFSRAVVYFDGYFERNLKFNVRIGDQTLIYHFSEDNEFEKLFWISQGISMTKDRG
jgi:hypothetical protein